MNHTKISHFDKKIELTLGQQCTYFCRQHTSVGITSDFSIVPQEVLAFVTAEITYKNPKQETNPVPGGDEAAKVYLFEAKEIGTCQLKIKTYMRGDITREQTIEVVVK